MFFRNPLSSISLASTIRRESSMFLPPCVLMPFSVANRGLSTSLPVSSSCQKNRYTAMLGIDRQSAKRGGLGGPQLEMMLYRCALGVAVGGAGYVSILEQNRIVAAPERISVHWFDLVNSLAGFACDLSSSGDSKNQRISRIPNAMIRCNLLTRRANGTEESRGSVQASM